MQQRVCGQRGLPPETRCATRADGLHPPALARNRGDLLARSDGSPRWAWIRPTARSRSCALQLLETAPGIPTCPSGPNVQRADPIAAQIPESDLEYRFAARSRPVVSGIGCPPRQTPGATHCVPVRCPPGQVRQEDGPDPVRRPDRIQSSRADHRGVRRDRSKLYGISPRKGVWLRQSIDSRSDLYAAGCRARAEQRISRARHGETRGRNARPSCIVPPPDAEYTKSRPMIAPGHEGTPGASCAVPRSPRRN